MGLLDSLFNSGSYAGQPGGLLDFIRNTQAQNDQYQPSPVNPQAQPLSVGNYQMPRIGDASQYMPSQAILPPNAQPTQGQLPMAPQAAPQVPQQQEQPLPPAFGGGGYLDRVHNGGSLIGSLFQSSTPQQQNLRAQYDATRQALMANGISPTQAASTAMLSVMNPEAAKTVLPELLTNREKYGVVSENPIEGKRYGFINERDQTINGQPLSAGGAASGMGSMSMLAPGVTYDANKSGEDYINQFSPEVKSAAKAYLAGDVMPTGNPRQQGISTLAKTVAQKYAADMGIPVSDALYAEKRKYRTELGSTSANTAGGQAKAFNQGIDHLSHLATTLEQLDNSNGLGIPALANTVNSIRQGTSTKQAAIADEAASLGQTVAGEVGKLFSGSAGGGVTERAETRARFATVKSKPQLAAALQATIETMQGGLRALEQRRDSILQPNSGVEFVDAVTKDRIAKIQDTIDRLKGDSTAPGTSIQEGATATNPQTGQKITYRNGKWQ